MQHLDFLNIAVTSWGKVSSGRLRALVRGVLGALPAAALEWCCHSSACTQAFQHHNPGAVSYLLDSEKHSLKHSKYLNNRLTSSEVFPF